MQHPPSHSHRLSEPRPSPQSASDRDPNTRNPAPPFLPVLHHSQTSPSSPAPTPATATRQSVVLSQLWRSGGIPSGSPHHSAPISSLPIHAVTTHTPSSPPDAYHPSSDLAISSSSIPSTTTTLTNTLPPTQSAALRALNAPAFQSHASSRANSRPAKSTSSHTTLSSQPVVVRTYSGPRNHSRSSSRLSAPHHGVGMSEQTSRTASRTSKNARLPAVDDFSFSAILRAVDPEIRDAIDAIAEICAKSRLSLADQYDAHLPPQGEITGTGPGWVGGRVSLVGRGRLARAQVWPGADSGLGVVPEASSSSERLAGDGAGKKRSPSAYGSLKSVISGGSRRKLATSDSFTPPQQSKDAQQPPATTQTHPSILLITSPQPSKHLSLPEGSSTSNVPDLPNDQDNHHSRTHTRNISSVGMASSGPRTRTRSSTLSSLAAWIPWGRRTEDESVSGELARAEARLRELLVAQAGKAICRGE